MEDHPFVSAVKPLVDAVGGRLLPPADALAGDVVLNGEGEDVVAVRLPRIADSLGVLLAGLERGHGRPLRDLDRGTKQSVVRTLEERGAFSVRHGVETVTPRWASAGSRCTTTSTGRMPGKRRTDPVVARL